MKTILALLATVVVIVNAQIDTIINGPECGQRPDGVGKVLNGAVVPYGDINWHAFLKNRGSFTCGGSLINHNWVVTAAHCISISGTYSIDLGLYTRNAPESWVESRAISKTFNHPSYSSTNYKNDISLLRFDTAVAYSTYIGPICFPRKDLTFDGTTNGTASGFGATSQGGATSNRLLYVSLRITTDGECNGFYGNSYDPETMVCAGDQGDKTDTCQGDSGGSVVYHDNKKEADLIGITSWGRGCGDIGVYTRVSNYVNWVQGIINANSN